MNREQLLADFNYPAFQVGKQKFCFRLESIHKSGLNFYQKKSFRVAQKFQFQNQVCSSTEDLSCLIPGDWLGIELNSQKKIKSIQLLAPRLKPAVEFLVSEKAVQEWNQFLQLVRDFFNQKKFLEVSTPTLVVCPGTEPFLEPFRTQFARGRQQLSLTLPTSPELHLKKLVAAGYGAVFEIRPCFRNGEISPIHQPEFWMIEWYRPGHELNSIKKDCQDLILFLLKKMKLKAKPKFQSCSMQMLFQKHLGFDLKPETSAQELISFSEQRKIAVDPESDFDDAFYHLFVDQIETKIETKNPTFVDGYPPSQAALARLTSEGWGDRFELYWQGLELANAYHELNDPRAQRLRSDEDLQKKKQKGFAPVLLDENFFIALESGLPPTSGIAMGLERLFMALTGRQSIDEIRLFPMR